MSARLFHNLVLKGGLAGLACLEMCELPTPKRLLHMILYTFLSEFHSKTTALLLLALSVRPYLTKRNGIGLEQKQLISCKHRRG